MSAGSDRIGALDFQESASEYVARESGDADLNDLMTAAESVETGMGVITNTGPGVIA